jgi:hypothetical protein
MSATIDAHQCDWRNQHSAAAMWPLPAVFNQQHSDVAMLPARQRPCCSVPLQRPLKLPSSSPGTVQVSCLHQGSIQEHDIQCDDDMHRW